MDNLRSLNRSLPASHSTKPLSETKPPEELLQTFKEAALSVTNLYKQAAISHQRARLDGYQDALDDLLSFLDKEDLGLSDGEGWRVRQWATERLDGDHRPAGQNNGGTAEDSDEERDTGDSSEDKVAATNTATSSATMTSNTHSYGATAHPAPSALDSPSPVANTRAMPASVSPPSSKKLTSLHNPNHHNPQPYQRRSRSPSSSPEMARTPLHVSDFSFRTEVPPGMDLDSSPLDPQQQQQPAVRAARRKGHAKSKSLALGLGNGAGTKRKFAMGDFFDFSDLKDFGGRDRDANGGGGGGGGGFDGYGGGGKKGRLV